jgi:hypothetical protein
MGLRECTWGVAASGRLARDLDVLITLADHADFQPAKNATLSLRRTTPVKVRRLEPSSKNVAGSGLFAIWVLMVYEPTDQNSFAGSGERAYERSAETHDECRGSSTYAAAMKAR